MTGRSSPSWPWPLLAAHLAVLAGTFQRGDPVIPAVTSASLVLLLSVWFCVTGGRLTSMMLPLLFAVHHVVVFAYLNLAYLKLTDERSGLYHDLTAYLAALMAAAAIFGAGVVHAILGREPIPTRASPIVMRSETLVVAGAIFGVLAAGSVSSGWLNSRWEQASNPFGAQYIVSGLGPVIFFIFVVLGTRIQPTMNSPRTLVVLLVVTAMALLQGLSGGRGVSVFMVGFTLMGAIWARVGSRTILMITSYFIAGVTVFSLVVQEARGREGFGYGTAEQRATLLVETAQDIRTQGSSGNSTFEPLLVRLFEFSAQVVIDQTEQTGRFAGFENFERLELLFVPQVFAPSKLPLSDGIEVLIRDYGYVLDARTGVPLTLMADAYRRGGWVWVLAIGLIAGAMLRLLMRLTVLVVGADLALVPMILYMTMAVGLLAESVLGAISILTYAWIKQISIFLVVAVVIRAAIRMNDRRASQLAGVGIAVPGRVALRADQVEVP